MRARHYLYAALSTTLLSGTNAGTESKIVPKELQDGFSHSDLDIEVLFSGKTSGGFKDGTTFEPNDVASAPTFVLGNNSAINTFMRYTVIMVDTTCDKARTLHFAQANLKYMQDHAIPNRIASESKPQLEYKSPGAFKETGDDREYSFLIFPQDKFKELDKLVLPGEGEAFDAQKFMDDNNLDDAEAGVGMIVKLGGKSKCEGGLSNNEEEATSTATSSGSKSTALLTKSSRVRTSSLSQSVNSTTSSGRKSSTTGTGDSESSQPTTTPGESPQEPLRITSTLFLTSGVSGAATGTGTRTAPPGLQTTGAAPAKELSGFRWTAAGILTGFVGTWLFWQL